jgi:hypothetical protein
MKKKKCPFHRGQRVRRKGTKNKKYGIVMSNDWYTIGDPLTCTIPGGPLIIEGLVAIQWIINGKRFTCVDKAEDFEVF